ncbi:unnamed protein product [Phyllotreta striolata]|uniref:Uncharacterized protein n=1 Tax=Phyllotreta striolata TaxID=444603 RepID=A0A9N9TQ78_PHYSR|nr:unnamed protein product [Phyllotreta striolata]
MIEEPIESFEKEDGPDTVDGQTKRSYYSIRSDTSKRKREKRTLLAGETDMDLEFMELEIRKYCPKKIFDIIVINEVDGPSQEQMLKTIDSARRYEDCNFSVTFIKYTEVMGILEHLDTTIFPESIRKMVEQILDDLRAYLVAKKADKIPFLKMAIMMKIKLMEVMIHHYQRELDKMKTRKVLIEELDHLTRTDKKVTEKGDKQRKTSDTGELEHLDTESDVIFDDDIYNHVWFYAFEGIYNIKVLILLLSCRVPITALIKINTSEYFYTLPDSVYAKFWSEMDDLLFTHNRSEHFENTMLMQFTMKGDDYKDILEEFLYTIKFISEIKFQHLNYIRHIRIYEMDQLNIYHLPLHCMQVYNKLVSKIPIELVTEAVILSSILEETCFQLDGNNIEEKFSIPNTEAVRPPNCPDPLVAEMQKAAMSQTKPDKPVQSFTCYHKDRLGRILKMYKPVGKLVYDLSFNVLKCIHPFNLLNRMITEKEDNQPHKHDIDPSKKIDRNRNTEIIDDFLNLMVLSMFEHQDETTENFQQPDVDRRDSYMENLIMYDHVAFCNKLRPKLHTKQDDFDRFDMSYNVTPVDFYWKQHYPSHVLMQEIGKAQNNFSYVDTTYCPETDRVLVQFSDWLDEFGLNTKIYYDTLSTPVCLRDFCRYTVMEIGDWLQENPPAKYVRKSEEAEICKGAKKLKTLDIADEYKYLLETESGHFATTLAPHQTDDLSNEVSFDEMMHELETYPTNTKLKEEYTKERYSKDFLAYDFGTKYFALSGARTIFVSHDGVKISIDNCKFVDDCDKCMVTLMYGNNNFTLHSSENFRTSYACHWILEDGSIIVFEIQKKRKAVKIDVEVGDDTDRISAQVESEKTKVNIANYKVKRKTVVEPVQKEDDKCPMNIYQGICEAIETNSPIYKIKEAYQEVVSEKPVDTVPLAAVLERILAHVQKTSVKNVDNDQTKSKRFVPIRSIGASMPAFESAVFRVTLPSGVHVSCHPSFLKETLVEIKQEPLNTNIPDIKHEEFRLFTREGYILIKKVDGTIRILMSNGNIIDFEKLKSDKETIRSSTIKPQHCKTTSDYRKRLNKFMKNAGKTDGEYYISRRSNLETKRGYVVNEDLFRMLDNTKIPYLKTSLLNFEGTKTILEGNKISQKKLYYTVAENDFCEEEIFYERRDGFKCILYRTADKIVEFADGTRITTNVVIANELVDGYVYVTLHYKYEHPHYATVIYGEDDILQVLLNNALIEKTKDDKCLLRLDAETTTTVNADHVVFEKRCKECDVPFKCTFDISVFHCNLLEFSKQFVHVEDSYLKHLFVDYAGICRVNKNFIVGNLNSANCNHRDKNVYKKLYAIKKTRSGEEYFRDKLVKSQIEKCLLQEENATVIKTGKTFPKVRIEHKYYQNFVDSLLTKTTINSPIALTKYKESISKTLYYSTIKVLKEVLNPKYVQILLSYLVSRFSQIDLDDETLDLINWLANRKKEEANLIAKKEQQERENQRREEAKYCKCIKDKRTFARKISQWSQEYKRLSKLVKQKNIPLYFNSDFCQRINKR